MATYRPTEPSYRSALMREQQAERGDGEEPWLPYQSATGPAEYRLVGDRVEVRGTVEVQALPRKGLTGARRLKITGDGVVIALCMPFMVGMLWHRGSALWAVVSAVWGCWTRGVNC